MLPTDTMKGTFAPGTTKRKTVNMYDTQSSTFQPRPEGPFEAEHITDQPAAHEHFDTTREIKLKDPKGMDLPATSYVEHYPPKTALLPGEPLELALGGVPFTATSTYDNEFWNKPRAPRPVEPLTYTHRPGPMITRDTTNQDTYKPFEMAPQPGSMTGRPTRNATAPPPAMPSIYDTTYRAHYIPKEGEPRVGPGTIPPKDPLPWLNDGTTYRNDYAPKGLALLAPADYDPYNPFPFGGTTEYRAEYPAKEADPQLPPLTGVRSREGLELPLPRRSLGVEFVHKGVSDRYFVLIPRTLDSPCSARQVFTTVHDNQEQACILILYGDDPVASNNTLLGQFDIVNIPPAPKDVPRIEVTFHLSRDMFLTVEARDLDTARHKRWLQRGDIVVLR
nr:Chain 5F, Flagellar associated protein [Chlamydomonas reinhardtii]8GLV_7B Chain 7B, Flagellar associated protein [Chlamydomonas reinhardtii]8GLV_Gs Chain Gs, Flagellar associated protein [Chlamydomonas reinhardtii]